MHESALGCLECTRMSVLRVHLEYESALGYLECTRMSRGPS